MSGKEKVRTGPTVERTPTVECASPNGSPIAIPKEYVDVIVLDSHDTPNNSPRVTVNFPPNLDRCQDPQF